VQRTLILLLLGLLPACAEDRATDVAPSASERDVAAVPRVKPRLVTIELPRVVHRALEEQEDGSFLWGVPEPIDGVKTCATERRDVYSPFAPYEPIEPPICVTTRADELPSLSGLPPNSDLTIIVSKRGYLPSVKSFRVEAQDVPVPSLLPDLLSVLFKPNQEQLFAPLPDSPNSSGEGPTGFIALDTRMLVIFPHPPAVEGQALSSYGSDTGLARDGQLKLTADELPNPSKLDIEGRTMLYEVPAATYSLGIQHPRTFCETLGYIYGYSASGLSTDAPEEVELRVLPGHVTFGGFLCMCLPPSLSQVLLEPASCTFMEPDPATRGDAGVPYDAG
jgi:hypothetical protein